MIVGGGGNKRGEWTVTVSCTQQMKTTDEAANENRPCKSETQNPVYIHGVMQVCSVLSK